MVRQIPRTLLHVEDPHPPDDVQTQEFVFVLGTILALENRKAGPQQNNTLAEIITT